MPRSSAGTLEAPGNKVGQKSDLNKAILDPGCFEVRRQLEYKAAWRGGFTVVVPAAYTSQTWSRFGQVAKANRKTQALFACVTCGYTNNADHVGAVNIFERGQRLFACGGMAQSGRLAKQEPAEGARAPVGVPVLSAQAAVACD